MTVLDSLRQLLGGATAAIQNVKQAEGGIRERLDALTREESDLLANPEAPTVCEENLKVGILAVGDEWTEAHSMDVARGASGRIERSPGPAQGRPADRVAPPRVKEMLAELGIPDWFCAMAPDLVLEGLRRGARKKDYESAPAMATRLERLAEIEKERETLHERHAELVDEAEGAGVRLQHLPEEIAARLKKQRRRAAWEADVRMNSDYYSRVPSARPPEPE
jgi:hypothetical protein